MTGHPIPEQVADGIFRLRLPMRFNPGHINSYLLWDGDGWAIVDCGNHSDETRAVWRHTLDQWLAGQKVTRVMLTHAHPDHYGSAPWLLAQTGAQLHLAAREWHAVNALWRGSARQPEALAEFFLRRGVAREALPSIQVFMEGFQHGCPSCDQEPVFIEPGDCLEINGDQWRLHGGYGHTPCNLLLMRQRDGVLITGDQVLPAITPNVSLWFDSDPDPMGSKLESLERLAGLQVSLAMPAHGDPFDHFSERCQVLARTYQRRLSRVRKRLRQGAAGLGELSEAGFGKAVNGPLYMLVAGQLLALLAYLEARGEVAFDGDHYRLGENAGR